MLIGTTARLLTNLGSLVVTGVFVLVTTVFLLLQTTHLSERIDREWGPGNLLNAQAAQVAQRVASFFSIRVRVNLIVATAITIWLAILGVDLAVLWGILAFFLGFIMYIGVTIAALPLTLLALAESGPWWAVMAFLGVLLINMGIENIVACHDGTGPEPDACRRVGLSLVFWAWVLGPRLYPRYPLTVIVVMILASNPDSRWLLVLLTMDTIPDTVDAQSIENTQNMPAPNAPEQP